MLVATRDPSEQAPAKASGLGRLIGVFQLAGSILAVPVGLVSAYSVYHSTFSDDAKCQSLRANIISMMDKSADAKTLRALVRRDVKAFEQSCAAVDPDAVAAFKTLLAEKPAPVPPPAQVKLKPSIEEKAANVAPAAVAPVAPAAPAPHATTTVTRGGDRPADVKSNPLPLHQSASANATSDEKWLEAVRGALTAHHPEVNAPVQPASPPHNLALPAQPVTAAVPPPAPQPAAPPTERAAVEPAPMPAAPALPPPAAVPNAAQPAPAASNHPVPPGTIPGAAAPGQTDNAAGQSESRFSWVGKIPVVGRWIKD